MKWGGRALEREMLRRSGLPIRCLRQLTPSGSYATPPSREPMGPIAPRRTPCAIDLSRTSASGLVRCRCRSCPGVCRFPFFSVISGDACRRPRRPTEPSKRGASFAGVFGVSGADHVADAVSGRPQSHRRPRLVPSRADLCAAVPQGALATTQSLPRSVRGLA